MTKSLAPIALCFTVALASLSPFATAATVTAGSSCHSITPSQATKFEWRTEGIKNTDAGNPWWVNCPIQRPTGTNELELSLRVYNDSNRSIDFECNFREMYGGSRLQGTPVSANIGPNSSETLIWVMAPNEEKSIVNAACRLPEGLQIEAIIAEGAGGSGGGASGAGAVGSVEACLTYAKESANPGIRFNNGAVIENVRGNQYSGPDSLFGATQVVLFNAEDGKWYELRSGDIQSVSMLEEPETCFEPNLVEIDSIRQDSDSWYVYYELSDGTSFREYGECAGWEVDDILTDEVTSRWANLSKASECP